MAKLDPKAPTMNYFEHSESKVNKLHKVFGTSDTVFKAIKEAIFELATHVSALEAAPSAPNEAYQMSDKLQVAFKEATDQLERKILTNTHFVMPEPSAPKPDFTAAIKVLNVWICDSHAPIQVFGISETGRDSFINTIKAAIDLLEKANGDRIIWSCVKCHCHSAKPRTGTFCECASCGHRETDKELVERYK